MLGMRVHVSILPAESGGWGVVGDVAKLIVVVFVIANAMFVIAGVPDFLWCDRSRGEGVSALDELETFWQRLVRPWRYEEMDMVWHDCEAVKLELSLLAIAEESLDEDFCVGFCLEVAMLEEYRDGYGVRVALLRHHAESIPQG